MLYFSNKSLIWSTNEFVGREMMVPEVGDIVKYLNWVGVVLEVYRGEQNSGDVHLKIWFVKNVFQGKRYDLIPYDPDDELGRLQPATRDDLEANIVEYLQDARSQCDELVSLVTT